ncbi:MAG: hypothetical protein HYT13_00695 [Candidatus Liptonbacteria bacterium]|nr:hypothetical protein [Candidatus Liptonbacteria bacterium]
MAENFPQSSRGKKVGGPTVPAPPTEISIRTLESDLKSMSLSGGSSPLPKYVAMPPRFAAIPKDVKRATSKALKFFFFILAISGLLAIGYYVIYPALSKIFEGGVLSSSPEPVADNKKPLTTPEFTHRSFFRATPDEVLKFVIPGEAVSAAELQTFGQRVLNLLAETNSNSKFLEIEVQDQNGGHPAISEFFSSINVKSLSSDFLLTNFNPDFNMFVYRDQNGSWPGYLLELKPGKSWLFFGAEIEKLERSPDLENLFLTSPGVRSNIGFKDGLSKNQPVRILSFTAPGAAFVYLSIKGYLIFSASLPGLEEAIRRL